MACGRAEAFSRKQEISGTLPRSACTRGSRDSISNVQSEDFSIEPFDIAVMFRPKDPRLDKDVL